jgi:glycosyltransferase involved in cell wall biosynthesis
MIRYYFSYIRWLIVVFASEKSMRILIALPGIHRYDRGAEIAFIAVAKELAKIGDEVTLLGSGEPRSGQAYRYLRAASLRRERFESFPSIPLLRNEYCYEELTFVPQLLYRYRPSDYDLTVTCSYPFTNWALRRPVIQGPRPPHVFVTHNGDWAPHVRQSGSRQSEYRFFDCDGLICINPDFYERNKESWNCRLIPNGVDNDRFCPGPALRQQFGLPADKLIVLMVSALIPSKRVEFAIDAVSRIPDAHLVVAGDGPLRKAVAAEAEQHLSGRFTLLSVPPDQMPSLYRSADVFLQSSKDEPFPLVFLEAMACGVPIVGHDIPRVRWFVGDDEFLADMDDPAAVAQSIEQARSLGSAGRDKRFSRATAFSWAKVAGMYRDFFQEIISSFGPK